MRRRRRNNGARDAMSVLVSVLLTLPAAGAEAGLDARLAPLVKAHKGKVAVGSVNKRMAHWGLKETRINAKVYRGSTTSVDPERTRLYGLGSTTAGEMVKLFERIQTGDGIRPVLKLAMLEHLKRNEDKDK